MVVARRTHVPSRVHERTLIATSRCPAAQALLAAGARMKGKTHMDELAYSLNGENVHYGTPVNPAAPGRIPGGSSSGSAVSGRRPSARLVETWGDAGEGGAEGALGRNRGAAD